MKIATKYSLKKVKILLVLIIFSNLDSFPQDNLSNLFQKTLPSVLKIETFDSNDNPLMMGTGFFISSNGKAVSNLHVFKGANKAQITTASGKIYKIDTIWYKTDTLDLVIFNIVNDQKEVFPFLNISINDPKIGAEVFVIGNPIGLDFTISNGIISSIRRQSEFGQIIQTSAPISAGSSGSPLIDMNGLVLGVITYTFSKGQNLNFAISLLDKNLTEGFVVFNPKNYIVTENSRNSDWIEDKYDNVRASHLTMCYNWRFNIDFLKNMSKNPSFEWPINKKISGRLIPVDSYVRGYHDENNIGTTALFVVDKNLAYVISFGTDMNTRNSLLLVSRITNGEPVTIFNYVIEKERIKSSENRYLEKIGNSKIALIIEDKIYVRSIYIEDHVENIPFSGDSFYLKNYDIK